MRPWQAKYASPSVGASCTKNQEAKRVGLCKASIRPESPCNRRHSVSKGQRLAPFCFINMSEDSAPKRRKYNPPPPYVSVTTVASLHLTQEVPLPSPWIPPHFTLQQDRGALERHDKLISRKSFRVLPGLAIPVWPHQLWVHTIIIATVKFIY